jgi:hypothetical protein
MAYVFCLYEINIYFGGLGLSGVWSVEEGLLLANALREW